jgi:hypothetical protein
MSSEDDDDEQSAVQGIVVASLVFFGIGALLGSGIGGDRKAREALSWAEQTVAECERSYRADGYDSVTDCLKGTIDEAEVHRREDLQGEDVAPR